MRVLAGLVVIVLTAVLLVTRVEAQTAPPAAPQPPGVQIETTPAPSPERPVAIIPPGLHYETTRPPESGVYPHDYVRVEHDPAFIEPFVQSYETNTQSGHYGLAGWTSPNTPVGPPIIYREVSGWPGFGFSIVWGGPPRARPGGLPPAPVR